MADVPTIGESIATMLASQHRHDRAMTFYDAAEMTQSALAKWKSGDIATMASDDRAIVALRLLEADLLERAAEEAKLNVIGSGQ